MNNILVLINLSAGAERIAKLSLKVAQQLSANVLLCNVFELPVRTPLVLAGGGDATDHFEDKLYLSIEELADKVKTHYYYEHRNEAHQPKINCLHTTVFNSDKIKSLVAENHVNMIVTGIPDLLELNTSGLLSIINNADCPVLVIPENVNFSTFDSTAYLTDLRYCDVAVVNFLKKFNSKIFVTHVSSSGIPDIEDCYAQNLLTDAVANKVGYNKLFLRNIKGTNRKRDLETVTNTAAIKFFTIVNHKHYVLERFLSDTSTTRRNYHNVPLMIIPYPNWRQ
ncbi:nucleotide-binding universal stress UspA family protein [Mucilaginibacter gracilis]|uniref:Nucleotide-binding universal stress UspA family protein n=1 Tax=Mucilaginibacter gracilis TaxID=423350 RepID=A0A495J1J4_9SPHI|nr:universal stress protein [Mucilaginibacter gracilis]RKR82501.1 nucleotide-binding universal stress UspA family protein [Mucilaginibacter gracilis]